MSTEENLESLYRLTGFLWNHKSEEIRNAIQSLREIEGIILRDHQPSFRRELGEPRFGYRCFVGAGEQSLKCLVNDLKVILKPVRILLKPKGPWSKVVNSIHFSQEEILELHRISSMLGSLVTKERLVGYIPYVLNKIRTASEWRQSKYATRKWTEINIMLTNDDETLNQVLLKVASSLTYDIYIVKMWIQLGPNLQPKDTYIARCIKNHETDKLHQRVWRDEVYSEYIAVNDDLETKAYFSAFQIFRMEWFTILNPGYCELTEKAKVWLSTH